jgi:tetratricopeptide (TPR) repeat protein
VRAFVPAASLVLLWVGQTAGWAVELFAGVSEILVRQGDSQTVQVVEFKSDLPFRYQMQVLDRDQILLRLYNAQLSRNLMGDWGAVRIQSEKPGIEAVFRGKGHDRLSGADYQEIMLSGPSLGHRQIQIIGAEALPLPAAKFTPPAEAKPVSTQTKTHPQQVAASPASKAAPGKTTVGKAGKPLVVLPNLAALENAPASSAAVGPQESTALLGVEMSGGYRNSRAGGPAIAAITEAPPSLSRLQPDQPHGRTEMIAQPPQPMAPLANPAIPSQGQMSGLAQPPSLTYPQAYPQSYSQPPMVGPGYNAAQSMPQPETQQPEMQTDPDYEVLIPLPRYQGGAPPIQAVTLDKNGKTVMLNPKKSVIPEFGIGNGDGGQNMLFQAEPEDGGNRVSRLMASALTHYRNSAWDAALKDIHQAVAVDSANADLYAAQGEIEMKQSKPAAAALSYEKAAKLAPGKHDWRYAQILILAGKRPNAITVLERVYRSNPKQAQVAFTLGTLHEELGNTAKALEYLKQAARLHPASSDIQYNLGLAFELSGSREEAELHYRKALVLDPEARDAVQALERVRN